MLQGDIWYFRLSENYYLYHRRSMNMRVSLLCLNLIRSESDVGSKTKVDYQSDYLVRGSFAYNGHFIFVWKSDRTIPQPLASFQCLALLEESFKTQSN